MDSEWVFRQEVIYIGDLVRGRKAGSDILDGYIFNDCELIGPAILFPLGDTSFRECSFESTSIFIPVQDDRPYFGVVGIRNCTLERCRFERVGIAGTQEYIDRMILEAG
jgi:hypothetical protein